MLIPTLLAAQVGATLSKPEGLIYTLAGQEVSRDAYREAIDEGYLWHEFGDSHLILRRGPGPVRG